MFSRKNRNWEKKVKTEKLDKENSADGLAGSRIPE
jgi:hypothetical protein